MKKIHNFNNQTTGHSQLRIKTEHSDEQPNLNLYKFPKTNRYRNSHYIQFKKQQISVKKQQIKTDIAQMNEDYKTNKIRTLIESIENNKPYKQDLDDLLAQYQFFSKILNENLQFFKCLMNTVTLQFFPKGKLVCRLGQKVQKAYFILKGKLGIYTRINVNAQKLQQYRLKYGQQMIIDEKSTFTKKRNLHQHNQLNLSFIQRKDLDYSKIFANQDQVIEWFPQLRRVSSFYQEELIDIVGLKKNIQRVATLITDEDTILGCISKNQYMYLTNKFDVQIPLREERIECMKKFQIFSGWQKKLNMYSIYFQRKKYKTGQIIYKEGDIADKFYLIISGDVELSVNIKKKNENKQQFAFIKQHQSVKVSINILSKGNYIGQQQIINKTERKLTAQSIGASTEMLFLTKQNFLIMGYGTEFFQHLKKNIILKAENRQNILKKFNQRMDKQQPKTKLRSNSPQINFKFLLNKRQHQNGLSKINNFKPRFSQKVQVTLCHGNKLPTNLTKKNSEASLNLLPTNRELQREAQRKYKRKCNIKQTSKQKVQAHHDLKKVWKILNLDYLLTQQQDLDNYRKSKNYFYHHKLMTQSSEPKTCRPKSNTTYKQKLMYVNYLYDFNKITNQKNKQVQ